MLLWKVHETLEEIRIGKSTCYELLNQLDNEFWSSYEYTVGRYTTYKEKKIWSSGWLLLAFKHKSDDCRFQNYDILLAVQ